MNAPLSYLISHPRYLSIGTLFHERHVFEIPKYQRAYAWEEEQVSDFLADIDKCYKARLGGSRKEHFFGGLVCVETAVPGAGRKHCEIVDGQQRVATFVLFAALLVRHCDNTAAAWETAGNQDASKLFRARALRLRDQYLEQADEVDRKPVTVPRLRVSGPDQDFFRSLVAGQCPTSERESHKRLLNSRAQIDTYFSKVFSGLVKPDDAAAAVERLTSILNDDCSLIYIPATQRADAYRLFQVLNDRGTTLSAGDLLRAATLELLDNLDTSLQGPAEKLWDDILSDPPARTDDFLQWYYSAHQATRPKTAALFDEFMAAFFSMASGVTKSDLAQRMVNRLQNLRDSVRVMRRIITGEWPYESKAPVTAWDRNRLHLLVQELGHTNCVPLLLAGTLLKETVFTELVLFLERFVFRYKIVCNEHIGPASSIYFSEAKQIIDNTRKYRLGSLVARLSGLLEERATEVTFRQMLAQFKYSPRGSNIALKYLLITLEDHWRWLAAGAKGRPKCRDKSKLFDFPNTTIEHVYPQKASGTRIERDLEPLKQTLGNLVLLGPGDNVAADQDLFEKKRLLFAKSDGAMTKDVGRLKKWTATEIKKRTETMVNVATLAFFQKGNR